MNALNVSIQALGLISVGLLAVPALHAAKYGRLLVRLEGAKPRGGVGKEAYLVARRALSEQRDKWTPAKSTCLVAGTVCAGLSYGLALLAALFVP